MEHKDLMRLALNEAKLAFDMGEVPVGCVIADEAGNVVASAHNLTEVNEDATAHAELLAIKEAQQKLGRRLGGCTLYVTLEPCPMCSGAILLSRIGTVVFGARDWERGALLSNANLANTWTGGKVEVLEGFCSSECEGLLKDFFSSRR